MSENKIRKHYYMSDESINYINRLQIDHDDKNASITLRRIIKDHKDKIHLNQKDTINLLSEEIHASTINYLEEELKKIRIALNGIDFDSKTMIEIINGILILKNIGGDEELAVTNELESEVLIKAKKVVKERIFDYKYKNDGALY